MLSYLLLFIFLVGPSVTLFGKENSALKVALVVGGPKALALNAPRPEYPYEARANWLTGHGVCVIKVDVRTGQAKTGTMSQSTGYKILDEAALKAFRQWRFKPGTVTKVKIPIRFTMEGATY